MGYDSLWVPCFRGGSRGNLSYLFQSQGPFCPSSLLPQHSVRHEHHHWLGGKQGALAAHRAEVPGFRSWLLTLRWDLVCPSEMFLVGTGMLAKSLQSCPTICDFMNCSPPGSSVHGILQARILEWVAIPSSRGSFQPRDGTCISYVS